MDKKTFPKKSASEIIDILGSDAIEVKESGDLTLSKVTSLYDETPGVCFISKSSDENIASLLNKRDSFILAPLSLSKLDLRLNDSCWVIFVTNPRLSFIKLLRILKEGERNSGVDSSSKIHPKAKIGVGTYIGPFCCIGEVEIGDNCTIEANVTIKDDVKIGHYVTIKSSSTIGNDGFGFEFDDKTQKFLTFPHLGGVTIGDNVNIGSSSVIDRGVLGDTVIEKNCRIDNLVHIAHNVVVGENSVIVAQSMIGGSSKIGKNCWISPGVRVLNGLKIHDEVTLGMGAVVMKDVPPSSTYLGSPARSIKEHTKMLSFIKSSI